MDFVENKFSIAVEKAKIKNKNAIKERIVHQHKTTPLDSFDNTQQIRLSAFKKAVKSFHDEDKKTWLSFEIFPKDIPEKIIDDCGDDLNVNRQRHIMATQYVSKDTVIENVEKALSFLKEEKQGPFNEAEWKEPTHWLNHWRGFYNTCKDDENIIGFAQLELPEGKIIHNYVRPNDIVVNANTGEFMHYNDTVYDMRNGALEIIQTVKKKTAKLGRLAV